MKKIILFFSLCTCFLAYSQFTGKPMYNIRVERSDTLMGNIVVQLFPTIAPLHVANWDSIVNNGGYDSTAFHRVIPGFVIQGGDPNSVSGPTSTWGQGNPSQATVDAEFSEVPHGRGILSAARSTNINSASSQFFICHADAFSLDENYSVYGETVSGLDVVDLIVNAPRNSNDLPNDKISMFITSIGSNDSVPDSPTLIEPLDNETQVQPTDKFSWSAVAQAKLYRFELATDAQFTNIVYTKDTKREFVYVDQFDNGFTTYYWRVRANNGGHLSQNPAVWSFTSGVGTPQLLLPTDKDYTTVDRPFFDWEDVNGASKYTIQVSVISSFSNTNLIVVDEEVTQSHYQAVTPLELNKLYHWRVLATDNDGNNSVYSSVFRFRADRPKSVDDGWQKDGLKITPNPFDDELIITSSIPDEICIYSLLGEKVQQLKIKKGENKINTENFPAGVYIYKTSTKNGKIVRK